MTRVALKGMAQRRLRTALTALAIVLGVAMIAGSLTLTDTMRSAADSLSKDAYSGTAAAVSARTAFKVDNENGLQAPTIPGSALSAVRAVPGVGSAVGDIADEARIIKSNGKVAGSGPYFGEGYDAKAPGASKVMPFRLTSGHYATGPDQVVIDSGTAKKQHLGVGDRVRIDTAGPDRKFRITGIATFGSVKSIGTATVALFDLRTAQTLFAKQGRLDSVLVTAKPGVSNERVRAALHQALPQYKVQSAEKQDRYTLDGLKQFVSIIRVFLIAFGAVALLVGAFTIFNTLSITVAQRSRELAMLRTIGASRRQVRRSVLLEALAVGLVASLVGIGVGVGLAKGLNSVFSAIGLDLPQSGLVFKSHTIVVSLIVGLIVPAVAGLAPALRATRVSPVTALREGADIPPGRLGRYAGRIGVVVTTLGVGILALALFAPGMDATARLILMAPGAVLLFVGMALLSPHAVPALASTLGRPAQRIAGTSGSLARHNAMRNPGRTAATAAALMIGIALVAFVAVLGHGLRSSTTGALHKQVRASYVLIGQDGWSPFDPAATAAAAAVPGVDVATGVTADQAKVSGSKVDVNGIDGTQIGSVLRFDWKQGDDSVLAHLGVRGAAVTDKFASKHHLKVGDSFTATPASGHRLSLQVRGIVKPSRFNPLGLGSVTISKNTFDGAFATHKEHFAFLRTTDGTSASTTRALERALSAFPDTKVQTQSKFEKDQSAWVNQLLAIFYVLLGWAVIVSLFGMVNTLVLSVMERTRELGMLRAVGMSRRQVRRMVRHESIITALIGAALGIVVGLFLAAMVTTGLSKYGMVYSIPIGSLVAFVVVAIVAGVAAAALPARRASRLNVLNALQYE
jgi:putative ABC transport system permease protein